MFCSSFLRKNMQGRAWGQGVTKLRSAGEHCGLGEQQDEECLISYKTWLLKCFEN